VWSVLSADGIVVRFGAETCDLIDKLLTCNPAERITATLALEHDYFWTDPLPADPKTWRSFYLRLVVPLLIFFPKITRL